MPVPVPGVFPRGRELRDFFPVQREDEGWEEDGRNDAEENHGADATSG